MEDEVCYSTVSFKAFDNVKSKELQSEESVYAEVKRNKTTSEIHSKSQEKGVITPISPSYRRSTVCLGLLCFLLLSALIAVSILNYSHVIDNNKIQALYTEERTVNQKLLAHKELLEKEKKGLITQGEELNSTLSFILKQSELSLQHYCQSTGSGVQCNPCPQNWIQNGTSCYFFYLRRSWKTWTNSQDFCKAFGADLAIINSVEEQEFVNQHIEFYYDKHHGYWIGLSEKEKTGSWVWTNGAELELGFWIDRPTDTNTDCVLSMTSNNAVKSWKAASCYMYNRWICEMSVLTWPQFLNLSP